MKLYFKHISQKNRQEAIKLRVASGQENFVETVAQCLEEADKKRNWHPVGIYHGETLIGFAMYGYFFLEYFPFGRLWLDRLIIDARFQGKGYGKAALSGLLHHLCCVYPKEKKIYLSVTEGNRTAEKLYKKFGFLYNGETDIHGEKVMIKYL